MAHIRTVEFFRHVRNDQEGYGTLCLIYNTDDNSYLFGIAALNSQHDMNKFSRKIGRDIARGRAAKVTTNNVMRVSEETKIIHDGEKFVAHIGWDGDDGYYGQSNVNKLVKSLNKFFTEVQEKVFRMYENGKISNEKTNNKKTRIE